MDSPQSVVSPLKTSVIIEPEKQKPDFFVRSTGTFSKGIDVNKRDTMIGNLENCIGVLEVYVHQARDIQNICIYHKQDVYAKLCLTSDPENTVSTSTINGGGRNPVFNESLRLNVRTVDSSLKCEIYMMSRVKNYLEDQLLGFALVPLTEVVIQNGKVEKEFSLSSTDLFHSPAGFVQLSLAYTGASPEVMAIPAMPTVLSTEEDVKDSGIPESLPSELDKIEFPDPQIVNENQRMVSEYIGLPCDNMDSETSASLVTSGAENHENSELGVRIVESFSTAIANSVQLTKLDSPPSSVSTNGVSSPSIGASSESSEALFQSNARNKEHTSAAREKKVEVHEGDSASSGGVPRDRTFPKPVVSVNIEPEQNVVQQEIVDMYMKSMQQFTESLAKMKLPLDIDNGSTTNSDNSSSDQKLQTPKNSSSRVFYGSRAFF